MGIYPDMRELHYVSCENVKRIQDLWYKAAAFVSWFPFEPRAKRECFSAEGTSFQREIGWNSEGVHRGPASQDFYLLVC